MLLNEVLGKALPYQWTTPPSVNRVSISGVAEFMVNDRQYAVEFFRSQYVKVAGVEFTMNGVDKNGNPTADTHATDTGGELQVFATVVQIIKDFVDQCDPYGLTFNASGHSRIRLYDRIIKRFSANFPEVMRKDFGGRVVYIIHKKD